MTKFHSLAMIATTWLIETLNVFFCLWKVLSRWNIYFLQSFKVSALICVTFSLGFGTKLVFLKNTLSGIICRIPNGEYRFKIDQVLSLIHEKYPFIAHQHYECPYFFLCMNTTNSFLFIHLIKLQVQIEKDVRLYVK